MIKIEKLDDSTFKVTVTAASTTIHRVTLNTNYYHKLTGGRISPEQLVQKSFEFLLEREGNTSILSRFDLFEIGRYFPEYEQAIRKKVG
jgi:hypothetical protein